MFRKDFVSPTHYLRYNKCSVHLILNRKLNVNDFNACISLFTVLDMEPSVSETKSMPIAMSDYQGKLMCTAQYFCLPQVNWHLSDA